MVSLQTPLCDFGRQAPDFNLPGVDGRRWTRDECRGDRGLLVMFICNHCPYVKAVIDRIIRDARDLAPLGIGCVAIMANDPSDYPEDSFDHMQRLARELAFPFPYLLDETQEVAKAYGAVCTPDFFGYNADLELQYRGRLDESRAVLTKAQKRFPNDKRIQGLLDPAQFQKMISAPAFKEIAL